MQVGSFEVSADEYECLLSSSKEVAEEIISINVPEDISPQAEFILEEAKKLASQEYDFVKKPITTDLKPTLEVLNLLKENFCAFASKQLDLSQLIGNQGNLWRDFMCGSPLRQYAKMSSQFLLENKLLEGTILELGAGIGNTSRLIESHVDKSKYIRSDLNIKLLKAVDISSPVSYYDFNKPCKHQNLNLIFATNALHCAINKRETLSHIYDALSTGGHLVIAEGSPTTKKNLPWALNFACGIYDGWWDIGGFLPREQWLKYLSAVGFVDVNYAIMAAGEHDLGGLIWARK